MPAYLSESIDDQCLGRVPFRRRRDGTGGVMVDEVVAAHRQRKRSSLKPLSCRRIVPDG